MSFNIYDHEPPPVRSDTSAAPLGLTPAPEAGSESVLPQQHTVENSADLPATSVTELCPLVGEAKSCTDGNVRDPKFTDADCGLAKNVIENAADVAAAVAKIRASTNSRHPHANVIGLDGEWVSVPKKVGGAKHLLSADGEWVPRLSMLQLATADGDVYLFRTCFFTSETGEGLNCREGLNCPPELAALLMDERVVFAGFDIRTSDCVRIREAFKIELRNTIEITDLFKQACKIGFPPKDPNATNDAINAVKRYYSGTPKRGDKPGLACHANFLLGETLDKGERLADWNAKTLTTAQIRYAAADAIMTRKVAVALLAFCGATDALQIAAAPVNADAEVREGRAAAEPGACRGRNKETVLESVRKVDRAFTKHYPPGLSDEAWTKAELLLCPVCKDKAIEHRNALTQKARKDIQLTEEEEAFLRPKIGNDKHRHVIYAVARRAMIEADRAGGGRDFEAFALEPFEEEPKTKWKRGDPVPPPIVKALRDFAQSWSYTKVLAD